MPAILRIFRYQTVASQPVIGSTLSYGVIVGQGGHLGQHEDLQHYEVSTLLVWQSPLGVLYCPTRVGRLGLIDADGNSW